LSVALPVAEISNTRLAWLPLIAMSALPFPSMSPTIVSALSICSWPWVSVIWPAIPVANVIESAPAFAFASAIASRSERPSPPGMATLAPASFSSVRVVTV
jgi:hypothetical protein